MVVDSVRATLEVIPGPKDGTSGTRRNYHLNSAALKMSLTFLFAAGCGCGIAGKGVAFGRLFLTSARKSGPLATMSGLSASFA